MVVDAGRGGARFLFRMAKAARKRSAGLTVVTQDAGDVLGTDLGQAVVANAATQILLRQAPQAIDAVGDAFGLTAGERRLLLAARRGQGLLIAGTQRTGFEAVASHAEHQLASTGLELRRAGRRDVTELRGGYSWTGRRSILELARHEIHRLALRPPVDSTGRPTVEIFVSPPSWPGLGSWVHRFYISNPT